MWETKTAPGLRRADVVRQGVRLSTLACLRRITRMSLSPHCGHACGQPGCGLLGPLVTRVRLVVLVRGASPSAASWGPGVRRPTAAGRKCSRFHRRTTGTVLSLFEFRWRPRRRRTYRLTQRPLQCLAQAARATRSVFTNLRHGLTVAAPRAVRRNHHRTGRDTEMQPQPGTSSAPGKCGGLTFTSREVLAFSAGGSAVSHTPFPETATALVGRATP